MPPLAGLVQRLRSARLAFEARTLAPEEARQAAPNVPASWYEQNLLGSQRAEVPFASGIGFVSSPFSSYYDKSWGVLPHADQARYRIIYRTVPVAHAAVDKLVESATAKGFGLDVSEDNPQHDRILEIVNDWFKVHPEFSLILQAAGKDLLTHGTAYLEPCYPETAFDLAQLDQHEDLLLNGQRLGEMAPAEAERAARLLPDARELVSAGVFSRFPRYHTAFINGLSPGDKVPATLYNNPLTLEDNPDRNVVLLSRGERETPNGAKQASPLVWLKPLDFLTCRIRRDAYGNVYGAIQYLVVPPVAFDTSKVIIGTWNPTSTFYESAYGVSLYQSLIRTQEAIWQIENDLLIIGHALAKPPHKFRRGTLDATTGRLMGVPDDPSWSAFQTSMAARQAGSDLFILGGIDAEPINQQLQSSVGALIAYLQYHNQQRIIALKVPPQLLGVPEGSTRTTATVNQGDYILTVQSVQQALSRMMADVFRCILAPFEGELGEWLEVPSVVWNPVMEQDETAELGKVISAYDAGLVTVAEARHLLIEHGIFELPDEGEDGSAQALGELQRNANVGMGLTPECEPLPALEPPQPAGGGKPGQPAGATASVKRRRVKATAKPSGR